MDELLVAIKAELQSGGLDGMVRSADIYITPLLTFIPAGVKMPCIGIKDGGVKHQYGASNTKDYTLDVHLVVYLKLTKKEAGLVGNPATGDSGILQLSKQVISILENNYLGIVGIDEAGRVIADPESKSYPTKNKEMIQSKGISLRYTKIEE